MYKLYTLEDVKKSEERNLFTFADFFSGGGGSSTGLKLSGGKELFANEFVAEAVTTFNANYPHVPVVCEDIKKLTGQELLNKFNIVRGELDILSGSPPCSAFSNANRSKAEKFGQTKVYSDGMIVENIEDLFFEYVRMVDEIRPKVVVAENVASITQKNNIAHLNKIINAFRAVGYSTTYSVMDSASYDVPMRRKRCIIIAVRNDVLDDLEISSMQLQSLYPRPLKTPEITLIEAFEDMENDPIELKMLQDYVQNVPFQKTYIDTLPKNPKMWISPGDENKPWSHPKGSYFNFIRSSGTLPSPSLTQRGQATNTAGVYHYNEDRKFTIKELKRIFSLPEDYILTGTFDQQSERICRMVTPLMMKHIGDSLYNKVILPYKELKNDKR